MMEVSNVLHYIKLDGQLFTLANAVMPVPLSPCSTADLDIYIIKNTHESSPQPHILFFLNSFNIIVPSMPVSQVIVSLQVFRLNFWEHFLTFPFQLKDPPQRLNVCKQLSMHAWHSSPQNLTLKNITILDTNVQAYPKYEAGLLSR
jgi:hypothetical protein